MENQICCQGILYLMTKNNFIIKARLIHGDRYDYSKIIYKNNKTKVIIICPEHGEFKQRPDQHLWQKHGCKKCGLKSISNKFKYTTKQFIERARSIHLNKYNYSKVKYVNSREKVIIICPEHGEFKQRPASHLMGVGCKYCSYNLSSEINLSTLEHFVTKAKLVHGNKYNYSKVKYVNSREKVIIICPEHGEFKQTPTSHIIGNNCYKCGIIKAHANKAITTEQFIERAKKVHGDKYNYEKVEYKGRHNKIIVICYKHGEFKQDPSSHLRGNGCPVCDESHGEKIIRQHLKENNIKFISEKSFKDLRGINNGLLRFDFFLPDFNICVEFDGRQHFDRKYCERYYNNYNTLKLHDRRKSKYCRNNRIRLIRIPYYKIKEKENILSRPFIQKEMK